MTKKNRIDRALYWYVRYGIRNAFELWWRCGLGLWLSLGIEWDVARIPLQDDEEDAC